MIDMEVITMPSKQEIFENKVKMIESLKALKSSWLQCETAFSNTCIDCNEYITDSFPFDKSFNDINVYEWVNNSIDKLEKSLKF
jgi:hypothetical protein